MQIMQSIGIKVKLLIIMRVDNVRAIFMAESLTTSQHTKHVDIHYHFVCEFVEDGFIRIIFVQTMENTADIFTKNVSRLLHEKHSGESVGTKESIGIH